MKFIYARSSILLGLQSRETCSIQRIFYVQKMEVVQVITGLWDILKVNLCMRIFWTCWIGKQMDQIRWKYKLFTRDLIFCTRLLEELVVVLVHFCWKQ